MNDLRSSLFFFFFFNDTATTEIYTLSLHDALPISRHPETDARGLPDVRPGPDGRQRLPRLRHPCRPARLSPITLRPARPRSEEHTSELQSLAYLVCRLLLEKKKKTPACTTYASTNP